MKITEKFIKSKTKDELQCEDSIYYNDDFAAVLDGVTSKSKNLYNGKTTGKMATELIRDAIKSLNKSVEAEEAISNISKHIESYYKEMGIYEYMINNPRERFAASLIMYSNYKKEIWMVGDCQCLVDEVHYDNHSLVDEVTAEARAFWLEIELEKGRTIEELLECDTSREVILPFLNNQAIFENHESSKFGYSVINGFNIPSKHVKTIKIPKKATEVILASDGYPVLLNTLEHTEAKLKDIISKDRLCFREFKSTKGVKQGFDSFDDRSYLKMSLKE